MASGVTFGAQPIGRRHELRASLRTRASARSRCGTSAPGSGTNDPPRPGDRRRPGPRFGVSHDCPPTGATPSVGSRASGARHALVNDGAGPSGQRRSVRMEVGEAVQRILVQHWRLIVVLVLAGACAGLVLGLRGPQLYAAHARVSLSSTDPQDAAMSQAMADSGRAVVTSPSHVARALAAIGASRDASAVAQQHVGLQAIGTSGVVELTVTDPDPYVAARLANALAQDLVATRRDMARGAAQSPAEQLANVQAEIGQIDAQIAH